MSDHITTTPIWLVGTGRMAMEYANVLRAQRISFTVIARSEEKAKSFTKRTGADVCVVPLAPADESYRERISIPQSAIVAVSVERLTEVTKTLLRWGVKRILVEKPGGLYVDELMRVQEKIARKNAEVYVAYNRRFYETVIHLQEQLRKDGGARSISFNFSEKSTVIADSTFPEIVKNRWLVANSSHVIDLAFFIGGMPEEWVTFTSGGLPWHPDAAVFSGAGRTKQGVLFSYEANWNGAGSWRVEVNTEHRKFVLHPLESLSEYTIGSNHPIVFHDIHYDLQFKPGLYWQTKAFTNGHRSHHLCTWQQQILHMICYDRMLKPWRGVIACTSKID